jgi:type IV pilus assembly protein PilX
MNRTPDFQASPATRTASDQRGYVLITSLLLLVVVTMLAVSMFRSFGVEEKIAGNVRDKQRALQAAETAQQYAERWLATTPIIPATVTCTAGMNANLGNFQVCQKNSMPHPEILPWATPTTYTPTVPTQMSIAASGPGSYSQAPQFYISFMGASPSVTGGVIYQVDAVGYGGSPSSVAVVESTFLVQSHVTCVGGC